MDAIEPGILADMIMDYKLGGHGREFFSAYLKRKRKAGVALSADTKKRRTIAQ